MTANNELASSTVAVVGLVVAVAHRAFTELPLDALTAKLAPGGCFIDVKSRFDRARLASAGFGCWRL